jgi:hypothetical protein
LLAGFLLAAATLLAALAAALRLLAGFLFTRVHTSSFVGPRLKTKSGPSEFLSFFVVKLGRSAVGSCMDSRPHERHIWRRRRL